ncbi:MAG: hypothetical protein ACP5UM_10225 [Anaerolineae bacterium]
MQHPPEPVPPGGRADGDQPSDRPFRFPWAWALALLALSCIPYLVAWAITPPDFQFGGLLANPLDGNSYLAKMRIGAQGSLRYYLIFSSEEQEGHFFYLPYLLWGNLTARLGLPLPVAYHLGRLLGGLFFLWSAHRFLRRFAPTPTVHRLAWALVAVSSGLGWAALPFGHIAPDLWVPEANSFYSLFANVHFPLATGLVLWLYLLCVDPGGEHPPGRPAWGRMLLAALCGGGMALVLPFAALSLYPIVAVALAWKWARARRFPWGGVWTVLASALPVALVGAYDLAVVATDPLVRVWTEQDVNLSPPLWDVGLAYGLVGAFALWGAWRAVRAGEERATYLVLWLLANLALLYAPTALQRRLFMGLHVPLCALAALGLVDLLGWVRAPARRRFLASSLVGFSALSNLVVIAIALSGAIAHDRHYYFTRAEGEAMAWLSEHAPPRSVVLAAPSTSLFVPVWAGLQVVYGHPLETAYAQERKEEVMQFFAGALSPQEERKWLAARRVRYLLWGPEEDALARFRPEEKPYFVPLFQAGSVRAFGVDLALGEEG